jgi:hypothetical protein
LREAAFILLASEVPEDPSQDEWDRDEQLAAEGKWDELGIDPPPTDDLEPVSVEEFIKDA